jgi:methionyl-tRNA synthetase
MTQSDIRFKENDKLDFLCPSCNKSFKTGNKCDVCGHDIISFNLNVGGKVELCSEKGCQNHSITFKDLDCALHSLHDKYSYGG